MNEKELRNLVFGYRSARIVLAGVSLGIFDALTREDSKSIDAVATHCGTNPRATRALLESLAAIDVIEKCHDGYCNSAAAESTLTTHGKHSRRNLLLHDLWHWNLWGRLETSLRTGSPVADRSGDPFFSDPEVLRNFFPNLARAMEQTSREESEILAERIELPAHARVLDLGGGVGNFLIALAKRCPDLSGVVLELPPVAALAKEAIQSAGFENRLHVYAANFLTDSLDPESTLFNVALLSRVLMGLSDLAALQLLQRVSNVLSAEGRILIHEFRCDLDGKSTKAAALLNIDMLLFTGGAVRTNEELLALLQKANLRVVQQTPIGEAGILIEAGKESIHAG